MDDLMPRTNRASSAENAAVVSKAALRAAKQLGLTNKVLAGVIGLSEPSVSRMGRGEYTLQKKELEMALLFVRLYRSLDAIVGGDDAIAGAWLRNANVALNGKPVELIQTLPGLMNVIYYLDARRAIV